MRPDPTSQSFTPKLFSVLRAGYRMQDFRADALAGLTVAIVALPLAMALGIRVIFSGVQPQPLQLLQALALGHDSTRVSHASHYPAAIALAQTLVHIPGDAHG